MQTLTIDATSTAGMASTAANDRSLAVNVSGPVTLYVVMAHNSSTSGRYFNIAFNGTTVVTEEVTNISAKTATEFTYSNTEAGTFYIWTGVPTYYYLVKWVPNTDRTVTLGIADTQGYYWASYYNNRADLVPEGLTAFYATSSTSTSDGTYTINLNAISEGETIPANTGVLLRGTASQYTMSQSTATPVDVSGNLFEGVTVDTQVKAESCYVLTKGNSGDAVLKLYSGTTLGAYKAYLPVSKLGTATAANIRIKVSGEEGIQQILQDDASAEDAIFNLQGQRLSDAPASGLYILQGRKVFIK